MKNRVITSIILMLTIVCYTEAAQSVGVVRKELAAQKIEQAPHH